MSLQRRINYELHRDGCTIMSPSFHNLTPNFWDALREKRQEILQTLKQEKSGDLKKLEQQISGQMQTMFLNENNEKEFIYLDMSKKPDEENVMLFFLRTVGEIYQISEQEIVERLKERCPQEEQRFNTVSEYQIILKNRVEKKKANPNIRKDVNVEEILWDSQWMNHLQIITQILNEQFTENPKFRIKVFVDKIGNLTEFEQKQLNFLLFIKGGLPLSSGALYLKINNSTEKRQIRKTLSGHAVQTPHDYGNRTASIDEI